MKSHFLKLNVNKTDIIEISAYPNLMPRVFDHFSISLDENTTLEFDTVTKAKNLGFAFDGNLCIEPQINHVVATCYYRLCNLYRIANMLSKKRKLQFVTAYIFSCLDYCNMLYYLNCCRDFKLFQMTVFALFWCASL